MNVKTFTNIVDKLMMTNVPYGYDRSEDLLMGIEIDGIIHDIQDIRFVKGGILIEPMKKIQEQTPKLLQPQKKNVKKENENETVE